MKTLAQRIKEFAFSDLSLLIISLIAYFFVSLELHTVALCILLALLALYCVFLDDLLPMLYPLFLTFCVSLLSARIVEDLWWMFAVFGPICGGALLFRFVKTCKTVKLGSSFPGLVAVTLAVSLGGLFSISPEEYFSFGSLYHVLGLGVMMVALYLFFKANGTVERNYDVKTFVCRAFYLTGIFIAFLILRVLVVHPDVFHGEYSLPNMIVRYAPWRNNAGSLAVVTIPFFFYFIRRRFTHWFSLIFLYGALVISGSRGALIVGGIEIAVCTLFFFLRYFQKKSVRIAMAVGVVGLLTCAVVFRAQIASFAEKYLRLDLNVTEEIRYKLFLRAIDDFRTAPLFGRGLGYGGNVDISPPSYAAGWQICWYHSLIPQIFASLGIFGALLYAFNAFTRLKTFFSAKHSIYTLTLFLSYAGIILYSQIDPGVFAPLPLCAVNVLLFVLLEDEKKPTLTHPLRRRIKKEKPD